MSLFKRRLSFLAALLAVLGAAACAPASTETPPLPTTPLPTAFTIQEETLPKNDAGVALVARVNEVDITLPEFERMLQRYQAHPYGDPAGMPKAVLSTMIQQELINQAATRNNIVIAPEDVEQELQELIADSGGQTAWEQWLEENDYTEDELRQTLRETLLTSQMRDRITGDLSGEVLQVHARHILVTTQEQANELMVRLRNGEDFATLAAQNSLDTTTSINGGDLGWFTQEELLEPSLSQLAFELDPGQIGGPVQTSLGYDIIQTLERENRAIDPGKRALLAQNRFENWLNTLVATAQIEQYL
ncbi:MAG: peptidylprolyl isomerase [Anaerolineae bacterium]|nr:peptidylprolyl isomerase [Anaerolineae bacterium]